MNVLIIDRDDVSTQLLRSKLEAAGHSVSVEESKDAALQKVTTRSYDLIFIDPSPLSDAKQSVANLRRSLGGYAYIALLSADMTAEDAVKTAANGVFPKPVDPKVLEEILVNAACLRDVIDRVGDDASDFPSAGGVIAKSAFNQILLSAIERADRYGERGFVLLIAVANYREILEMDGAYAADYVVAQLSRQLVKLRRQSDIIGQTAKHEYALMLQRPIYETEPVEAANRFAEALGGNTDIASSGATDVQLHVSLLDVPAGVFMVQHVIDMPKIGS